MTKEILLSYKRGGIIMAEEFLKEYLMGFLEANDRRLTSEQIDRVIERLANTDDIWETLTSYVIDYVDEEEVI